MADQTTLLKLPYILNAQAQKHVTHNEALRALDAIIQVGVLDRDLTSPPATPTEGQRFIVAASATGDWAGRDKTIAAFQDGAWLFYDPAPGWLAYVSDEALVVAYTGSAWTPVAGNLTLFGINTTADTNNRFAVSSPASLFNHQGSDHRIKVNKAASGNSASMLFQTNWSGRAEFGLTGDDNWHVKVSPDGSSWTEAFAVDRTSATVAFSKPIEHVQVLIAVNAVASISPPSPCGLVALSHVHQTAPTSTIAGLLSYDCGSTPELTTLSVGSAITNLNTSIPTGSTGASGKVSLAVDAGHIYIENRTSASIKICLTYLNGYHA